MRKLIAYSLCALTSLALGYTFLHPTFRAIADWLAPMLGPSILTLLISAYLLFGDPLRFRALLLIWTLTGIICGILIRRRLGGVSTAIGIYSTVSAFMSLSLYNLLLRAQELGILKGGNPLEVIPPLPRELTMTHIMEAPIIGSLLERISGLIGGGGLSPESFKELLTTLLTQFLTPIFISSTENLIVVAGASLIGVEMGKLVERGFTPWSEALRGRLRRGAVTLLLILIASLTVSSIPLHGEEVYVENLIAVADEVGRGYVAALFLDTSVSVEGIRIESTEAEGLLTSIIITHEGILELLSEVMEEMGTNGFDPSSIINLAPPTLLLTIYLDTPLEVAERRSSILVSTVSQYLGIELHRLISIMREINATEGPNLLYLSVHISSINVDTLSERYLDLLPSEKGGLAEVIINAYQGGEITPEGSADGVLLLAGFINPSTLLKYLPMEKLGTPGLMDLILPGIDGVLRISGLFSYWEKGVHSPSTIHTLNLAELLGVEELSLSTKADISNLLILVINTTRGEPIYGRIMTTIPLESIPTGMELEILPRGATLTATQLEVSFRATIPPYVEVVKTVSPNIVDKGDEVTVTVTVKNQGEEAIYDVYLNDSESLFHYPLSTAVIGEMKGRWPSIEPGGSRSITYRVTLSSGGIYTLGPALLNYRWGGKTFTTVSGSQEVKVRQPPPHYIIVGMFASIWMDIAHLLDPFTGGRGVLAMQLITVTVIVILAFQEIRNVRRWLKGG